MYVGKYFTEKGEFDQVSTIIFRRLFNPLVFYQFLFVLVQIGFMLDVKKHIERYQNKMYKPFEYKSLKSD